MERTFIQCEELYNKIMRFSSEPKVAVMGLFHKEAFFTPYYQAYYGNLFGNENIYILGDPDTDSFLYMFEKANLIQLGAEYQGDYGLHCRMVQETQSHLLEKYDTVIFAEADEFIFPDPAKYKNLKHFLTVNKDDYFRVQGYNVIHDIDNEKPIDTKKPIMEQRKWWYKHGTENGGGESKMLIVRKPGVIYEAGFHWSKPSVPEHPDLFNFHLHEFDFNICNSRVKARFDTKLPLHHNFGDPVIGWEGQLVDSKLEDYHRKKLSEKPLELIPQRFLDLKIV